MIFSSLYFILPALCLIANYTKTPNDKFFKFPLLILVIIFQCSGYMTGSDWRTYELAYNSNDIDYYWWWEPAFRNLVYISKNYLGLDFWSFLIIIKILCFSSIIVLFNKITKQFWLSLAFFLLTNANYLFINNPLRNLIADSIFWVSLLAFLCKKSYISLTLYIISILFHTSIILTIPLIVFFLLIRRLSLTNSSYITIIIMAISNKYIIKSLAISVLNILNIQKGVGYILDNGSLNFLGGSLSIKYILMLFLMLFIIKHKRLLIINDNGKDLICLSFVLFLSYRLSSAIPILQRISNCFEPIFWVCIANTIKVLNIKEKIFYPFILLLLLSFSTYRTISTDFVYIPYTNYFQYKLVNDNLPDYYYRSKYNIINSPFKKK